MTAEWPVYEGDEISGFDLDSNIIDSPTSLGQNTRSWMRHIDLGSIDKTGYIVIKEILYPPFKGDDDVRYVYELLMMYDMLGRPFVQTEIVSFPSRLVQFYASLCDSWLQAIVAICPTLPPNSIPVKSAEDEAVAPPAPDAHEYGSDIVWSGYPGFMS